MAYSTHRDLGRRVAELLGPRIGASRIAGVFRECVRPEHAWLLRTLSQPWRGHTTDTDAVLYYLLQLIASAQLDICTIDLSDSAGRDDNRDGHQATLDRTLTDHGLTAVVDPNQRNADCDGSIVTNVELSGIRFLLRPYDESTYQKLKHAFQMLRQAQSEFTIISHRADHRIPRYEVGYVPVQIGQPKERIPLEIGFCDPSRVLYHLVNVGYVARWPRDSQSLHILVAADDPYIALRMEGRISLPGYNPWQMGKYDLAEGVRVAGEWCGEDVESGFPDMRQEIASFIWATGDQRKYINSMLWRTW